MSPTTGRLVAVYNSATPEQRERGRRWYPTMRRHVRKLARQHGANERQAAAVLAITSPRCQLSQNLARAARALAGEPVRGFAYMDDKCAAALADADPLAYCGGPKVGPFAAAILGDPDALVLDTWAFAAAGVGDRPRVAERQAVDVAYREAAATVGEPVRDFQAVVWIVARESGTDSIGRHRRLRDLNELTEEV
jgi:hypothetical protein